MSYDEMTSPVLTETELSERLKSIVHKLRRIYDFSRWENLQDFEKDFRHEIFTVDVELIKLNRAFEFTQKVRWYEQEKKKSSKSPRMKTLK